MAGTVARPKVYIDYISYFRAIGLGVNTNISGSNINEDYSDVAIYNPSNAKTYTPITTDDAMKFKIGLGDGTGEPSKLVQSINWAGIFNHNYYDINSSFINVHR